MPGLPLTLLLVPLAYAAVALVSAGFTLPGRWRLAGAASGFAFALAGAAAVVLGASGPAVGHPGLPVMGTRLDLLTVVMLVLVTGIAGVILRFSRRYLDGQPGQDRFLRWFLLTVAPVTLLVVTNHLLVLALAWTATSLALHQLLGFFSDRPQAVVAAHKKFLLSRVADVAILGSVALLGSSLGTLEIDRLLDQVAALPAVPGAVQAAGMLLAVGVVLRMAQLPFHGWLIQVMEAPTPVSALLHAGVVNLGGFALIRLAGLMERLEAAQLLLVVAGTTTAVLAALVMRTRVSVKVSLAWSTCAQMGFMLVECGLGAWGLALLHLVAHSLYKAHAFLSSGRTVEAQVAAGLTARPAAAGLLRWALAVPGAALVVAGTGALFGVEPAGDAGLLAATVILTLALAPLLVRPAGAGAWLPVAVAAGVAGAFFAGHALTTALVPVSGAPVGAVRLGWVLTGFTLLYVVQAVVGSRPQGWLARQLYPPCFAGFYLDELFTRLTFAIWPPRRAPQVPVTAGWGRPSLLKEAA